MPILKRTPFEPLPTDVELVDSLLDVNVDEHDWRDDGDDRALDDHPVPGVARRTLDRLIGGRRG